jgi:hypothetical protein
MFNFLPSTNFKLFSQIKGNSINNCDFLKPIIYVRGGHWNYSPRAPKTLLRHRLVVPIYLHTRHHISGDRNLHQHSYQNFKSYNKPHL